MARFGDIHSIILPHHHRKTLLGFGIVNFTNEASAKRALENDRIMVKGKSVSLKQYQQNKKDSSSESLKIFIIGVPKTFTEEDLYSFYSSFVEVKEVKLIRDPATNKSKKIGFVWTHD